jgi:hypothetical protein
LYAAVAAGRPSPWEPLEVQYADFAVWEQESFRDGALEQQLAYWRGQLGGAPALLDLPTDHPRPAVRSPRGARIGIAIEEELVARIDAVARREGVTRFMILLAALQTMLGRYARQDDVVIGTPVAGRRHSAIEGLIGMFVNTLALRTSLADDPSFAELLARVRETTLAAFAHQDLPFERLLAALDPPRSRSHTPLF